MSNIFIGVYGTSDKTEVRIEHENGKLIGHTEVEEANIHLSVKHAWDAILRAIHTILKPTGIELTSSKYQFHIGLGLKYTELIEACNAFKKAAPKEIVTIKLQSDGYVLCLGAHNHNGGIIIVDQGTVGSALVGSKFYKVGGWGFPHADIGSFPWIGLEAIRLTLQWVDQYIEATPLIKAVYDYFDNNYLNMVQWAMDKRGSPDEYLVICKIVLNSASENDPYARMLLKESALAVDKIYEKLQQKSNIKELPCTLYGFLAPYIVPLLSEKTKNNLINLPEQGLNGAIKMIKETVYAHTDS